MKDVPEGKRSARFVCVIAIATPDGTVETVRGECHGTIAFEPRGEHGFGYDPVFYFPELGKTLAELPLDVKNRVSHRGKAAREAYRVLDRLAREARI
jgi:XTP/dITP diphosphohydrolase